jgi:hypothetical protein
VSANNYSCSLLVLRVFISSLFSWLFLCVTVYFFVFFINLFVYLIILCVIYKPSVLFINYLLLLLCLYRFFIFLISSLCPFISSLFIFVYLQIL